MKLLEFKSVHRDTGYFVAQKIEKGKDAGKPRDFDPHSHDYYVIMIITGGTGEHQIDFRNYTYNAGSVFFLSPGQVHRVKETAPNYGYVIVFNHDFLIRSGIDPDFFENINLFRPYGDSPPLVPEPAILEKLGHYAEEMLNCQEMQDTFRYEALGANLRLFLILSNSSCDLGKNRDHTLDNALITIREFRKLVNQNYAVWHKAGDYAQQLSITPNYLNKLVKTYLSSSTKDFIQNRIIIEAKRRLLNPKNSVKSVAYELGYSNPSQLSKMFKACTGKTLTEFRESLDDSF
ncbi:helix-turn-helix domain-containing protein [Robertkochia aurantiaca]|uniref:helix-turn-helix domain-containing protein n=1 Tax=Robertkochia aurantiaca TaxID=2873700 RepID=UPI001CCC1BE1|nr:AraC family transcriptional regulator [Robertkochia sp. 3YJGBD-33]